MAAPRPGRIALAALLGIGACAGESPRPGSEQAADPAEGPVAEVELFAPGVLSSPLPEFATAFTPSGDTVLFNRTSPNRSTIDLLWSFRTGGGWSTPEPFPPTAGSFAIDPFVEAGSGRLHLSMERPLPGQPPLGAGVRPPANLWSAARDGDRWLPFEPLPRPVNSDSSDVFGTLTRDGLMLFSSRRDGTRRVWSTRRTEDGWTEPTPVRFGSMDAASNPLVSPDGRWAVFAGGVDSGPPDLFLSCREQEGWGEPVRLPEPINSRWTEFAPGWGTEHLYFTSERPGVAESVPDSLRPPGDVYRTPLGPLEAMCPA